MLRDVEFHQLHQFPKPPGDSEDDDPTPAHLFAAWSAAHAELRDIDRATVAVVWERASRGGPLRFCVGGRPHLPFATPGTGVTDATVHIAYPPGSIGDRPPEQWPHEHWRSFTAWVRCHGGFDSLWTPENERGSTLRRGGFDAHVAHLRDPFAWLVIAEPLSTADTELLLTELSTTIPRLRQRENSEADQVRLEQSRQRFRHLVRARANGLWTVQVMAGARTPEYARRAAALLAGASDLEALPYILVPGSDVGEWEGVSQERTREATGLRARWTIDAESLAALARPPRQEHAGIRVVERVEFDLTPETRGSVGLGSVLDESDTEVGAFGVSADSINRHVFVAGATGAGKSQTVRSLLENLHTIDVPWLVIEPAKAEYAAMAGRLRGRSSVTAVRPGAPEDIPAGLNPLAPEPGFPLQTHLDLVRALFLAAFDAHEPFPQVLIRALTRCYRDLGWDLATGTTSLHGRPRYPMLADLQRTALEVVRDIGYGKEVADNVRGFVDVRIGALRLGTPGLFFEARYPIDFTELLRRNVVLEIEDIGNDQDKAFFIGVVLIRLFEHIRMHPSPPGLAHVTVIEEAHRLLRRAEPGSPASHAVELFAGLLAEVRAYGEGIVVAEQIPSKLVPDVIKNTAVKLIHRLPAQDDRDVVGATMNLDTAQSRHLVSLPPGRAAVFTDGMDRPIRISVPLGEDRESRAAAHRSVALTNDPHSTRHHFDGGNPFTLGEISQGRALAEDPRLTLWIELLTMSHLCSYRKPVPDRSWLNQLLAENDPRVLRSALAHRVDHAIDSRYNGLAQCYPPDSLALHLAIRAEAALSGDETDCDDEEVRWQAGQFRWIDVWRALGTAGDVDQPHPDTGEWEQRGLLLPGKTIAEQRDSWLRHPANWLPLATTITGNGDPPVWATATAALSNVPEARGRLLHASQFLAAGDWPARVLTPVPRSTS